MLEDQRDQRIARLEKQVQFMREALLSIAPIAWEVDNPKPPGNADDSHVYDWKRRRDAYIDLIVLQLNS